MVLTKNTANICCRAVLIIGGRLHQESDSRRSVTFVDQFLDRSAADFTGTLFDRSLYRIIWHVLGTSRSHCGSEARIQIQTAAHPSSYHDFFGKLAKKFDAF